MNYIEKADKEYAAAKAAAKTNYDYEKEYFGDVYLSDLLEAEKKYLAAIEEGKRGHE
jgi:hypothetical protein